MSWIKIDFFGMRLRSWSFRFFLCNLLFASLFIFFEVKGRSTARSYKKKENASTYKGCDYINKKVTQSLRN